MWQNDLSRGRPLDEIEASILSSSEYYDRQNGDDNRFIDQIFRDLKGAAPSAQDQQRLREIFEKNNGLRLPFAQELLKQDAPATRSR